MRRLLALLCLCLPLPAQALTVLPLVHLDVRGGYAGLEGQSSTPLIQGEVFAVPAMQLTDKTSLSPSVYVVGGGQQRSLEEDALFVETMSMGFRPQLKYVASSGNAYLLRLDARRAYNVEAVNESFGTGRYDYEEFGLGAGWENQPDSLPIGASLELSHRDYPNYHNIAAAVALTDNKNYYLKDYLGTKAETHLNLGTLGRLAASCEWKSYGDAYIVSAVDGVVDTTQTQHDLVYELSWQGSGPLSQNLMLGWDLDWQGNASNQNTFDTIQAVGLPNSDDYSALALGGSAQWKLSDSGFTLMGGYTLNLRNFNRPIQDPSGTYTQGMVAEVEHDLNLGFRQPLGHGLSFVGGLEAQFLLSNQEFASAGIPSYSYFSGNLGLQWDWQGAH
jgi:hypothetical protein